MPNPKQIVTNFDLDSRTRTTIEFVGKKVSHWAVQLEYLTDSGWEWVVRYDTAGGQAHRDRHLIAQHELVDLPQQHGNAIKAAQTDITQQALLYIEVYLEARRLEEKRR